MRQVIIEELTSTLEVVTEALDNVLLHQGQHMTPGDRQGRSKLVSEARTVVCRAEQYLGIGGADEAP